MRGPRHIISKLINEKYHNITHLSNMEWFSQENIKKSIFHQFVCFVDFWHFWSFVRSAKISENRFNCSPAVTSFTVSDFAPWWLVGKLDESSFQKILICSEWIPFTFSKIKSTNISLCAAPGLKRRQKGRILGVFWPFEGVKMLQLIWNFVGRMLVM